MDVVLNAIIWLMAIAVVAVCAFDHMRGKVDALSIRNVALVGFLIFMVLSARGGLVYEAGNTYNLNGGGSVS